MTNNGWIKLHRCLQEKRFYTNPDRLALWVHLLLSANHAPKEHYFGKKPIIIKPGQFITGRKMLAQQIGMSESKVERILTYFEKIEQQIEQQKSSSSRLITILNWKEYQQIEQQIEQQVNNQRTTSEQQVNTNNNDNNKDKENKSNTDSDAPEFPPDFQTVNNNKKEPEEPEPVKPKKYTQEYDEFWKAFLERLKEAEYTHWIEHTKRKLLEYKSKFYNIWKTTTKKKYENIEITKPELFMNMINYFEYVIPDWNLDFELTLEYLCRPKTHTTHFPKLLKFIEDRTPDDQMAKNSRELDRIMAENEKKDKVKFF